MGIATIPSASGASSPIPTGATTKVVEGSLSSNDAVYSTSLAAGRYAITAWPQRSRTKSIFKDWYIGYTLSTTANDLFPHGYMSGETAYINLPSTTRVAIAPTLIKRIMYSGIENPGYSAGPNTFQYVNGRYIYNWYAGASTYLGWSTDGVAWDKDDYTLIGATTTVGASQNRIAYGNGFYVSVGSAGNYINYSTNLSTWSAATPTIGNTTLYGVAWGTTPARFVVVANTANSAANVAYTSTSSMGTWTVVANSGISTGLFVVEWATDKFVAVGASGGIITSTDGVSWTTRTSPLNVSWRQIIHTTGKTVIIGSAGDIAYSTDCITWTTAWTQVSSTLGIYAIGYIGVGFNRSVYHNGKFYLVSSSGNQYGYNSSILTSTDGATWENTYSRQFEDADTAYTASPVVTNGYQGNSIFPATNGTKLLFMGASLQDTALPNLYECVETYISIYNVTASAL